MNGFPLPGIIDFLNKVVPADTLDTDALQEAVAAVPPRHTRRPHPRLVFSCWAGLVPIDSGTEKPVQFSKSCRIRH